MVHIPFSPSETLAETNHKSTSKNHLYFSSPCNHLTKENISYWFKIVLRNSILSEQNLMHFHIKLILFLNKMKTQPLFMQKELTISSFSVNASVYLERDSFSFISSFFSLFFLSFWHYTESETLHVLSQDTLKGWKGWIFPKHTTHNTGSVCTVCARGAAKGLIWF